MNFNFMCPNKIVVKTHGLQDLGTLCAPFGEHALVVARENDITSTQAQQFLSQANIKTTVVTIKGEPTVDVIKPLTQVAIQNKVDFVVAIGGGSVLDSGKMLAALTTNTRDILDYVEVIGKGLPMNNPSLPFVAVPTTSGTGAEVTKNGVIGFPEYNVKVSLRSDDMLANLVLLDPSLTLSVPKHVVAFTGMDALTQVLEPYVSLFANPITDAFCMEGLRHIAQSLKQAYDHPDDLQAKESMAIGSLFGGLALANAKLGAVHGFAGPIGGMYPIPHGVVCATLLPYVFAANIDALTDVDPNHPTLKRFDVVAQLLLNDSNATRKDAIDWILELSKHMNIPTLSEYGIQEEHFDSIIQQAKKSSSMKGNPIQLNNEQLNYILKQAL